MFLVAENEVWLHLLAKLLIASFFFFFIAPLLLLAVNLLLSWLISSVSAQSLGRVRLYVSDLLYRSKECLNTMYDSDASNDCNPNANVSVIFVYIEHLVWY